MLRNVLLTAGLSLCLCAAKPQADECGEKKPITVTAVCGRTIIGVGWIKPSPAWSYARSLPDVPLELVDDKGRAIARTTADAEGRFAFPRVAQGSYTLRTTEDVGMVIDQPLIVTNTSAACDRPIYAYMGAAGSPCRNWATLVEPFDLQPFEPEPADYARIVPPRPPQPEACIVESGRATKYRSVTIGDDGRVTVITRDCRRLAFEGAARLRGRYPYHTAAKAAVSADHTGTAWLALFRECERCGHDMLPLELVVVHGGTTRRLAGSDNQPIWSWMFQGGGKRVAFMEGDRMGTREHYELWDVVKGRRVAQYRPTPDARFGLSGAIAPQWVLDLFNAE